jgi:ketosteroid isomerase-like protein
MEPEILMKKLRLIRTIALVLGFFSLSAASVHGQTKVPALEDIKSQAELDKAITALDADVFDAYNHCDLAKFSSYLADDVEFYHDRGGVTLGKAKLTESVKKNICGTDVQRELVPGTFQAHLMSGYGAVELGVHRFLHPKTNARTGEASFVHLWQYKDGAWKMTRVVSYDHHEAQGSPK